MLQPVGKQSSCLIDMSASSNGVNEIAAVKYGDYSTCGWGPKLRRSFGYFTPDDWYEGKVWDLVTPATRWLDVGCGRAIFPSNAPAARILSDRCQSLTGLDPSDNIDENPFVHQRAKCMLEDFEAPHPFDLITLRMVVEHITNPSEAAAALARLCAPGGKVVIYTVFKWSPASIVAALTPLGFHHWAKARLWGAEEKDTFPTTYLMNTRRTLTGLMGRAGFRESSFQTLSDTRTTVKYKSLNTVELSLWRALDAIGIPYPERCFLAVYEREPAPAL